jgi:hypothetical protein
MSALFKKNLTDLVRGIRNNKNNEQQYISQCIQEIKNELRGDNNKDKMVAIQKLTYVRRCDYWIFLKLQEDILRRIALCLRAHSLLSAILRDKGIRYFTDMAYVTFSCK